MQAIRFIIESLLNLALFIFLLRVVLQLVRADFRNPISDAVLRLTNPLVLPLRRIIPPLRRLDLASVVALLLVELATQAIMLSLHGLNLTGSGLPIAGIILQSTVLDLAIKTLQLFFFAIIVYVLLGWVAPGAYSPAASLLSSICEPILAPVRRAIPTLGGLDLSPMFVLIGLQALLILLHTGL